MTTSPEPSACPSSETLEALLSGGLDAEQEQSCEEHLSACSLCQTTLEHLVGGRQTFDNVVAVLESDVHRSPSDDSLIIGELYDPTHEVAHDWKAVLDPPREGAGSEVIGSCGRFDVHAYQASGGMGIVFKGYDPATERTVAIKVLAPSWAANEISRARFLREARAVATLADEHVLPIFSVEDDGPYPFIVMPFIDGETLEQRVQRSGPLPFDEIRSLTSAIVKGLTAAHAAGIIHRDLKPANILLQGDHQVLLADFGLARAKDTPELTIPGTIPGTPEFMAPEQIEGDAVDHRADLFALGCLLQFMATGKPPFAGDRVSQILQSVTSQAPAKVTRDQPTWFRQLLGKLLQKDPNQRLAEASHAHDYLAEQDRKSTTPIPLTLWQWLPLAAILSIGGIYLLVNKVERIPADTPVYIEGQSTRYDSLLSAIAGAPSGATIVLRDGLHEVPGELIIHQPINLVAAKGVLPILRSRDTASGTVFNLKARTYLEGLTLRHNLTNPRKAKSLIYSSAPLTLSHCRLEQLWKQEPTPSPFPAAILATDNISLVQTEIDSTAGCAIFSKLKDTSPETVSIRLDHCAIAAVRGFYLMSQDAPKAWDISLTECHSLTGGLFCINEKDKGTPHWKIERTVIESSNMLMVRGPWQDYETNILPNSTWIGRENLYSVANFLHPWDGGPEENLQKDLEGWLQLCPGAQEEKPQLAESPLFVESLPESYRELRSMMRRLPPVTAKDLSLDDSWRRRFPHLGGSMAKVGPPLAPIDSNDPPH